ncbi:hypothetical protein [Aquiflexum sp.]|uniref:hypothetical protein n=1 Tax=Aquiflexum sp. TaxID=1872584 RepID=UPI0035948A14
MKKLSLEMLRLTSDEVLGRSQMKKITGGSGNCKWICTCGNDDPITVWDCNWDPTGVCPVGGGCVPAN